MNLEEYKGVFVFAQQVDNKLNGIALELVGKGKDLAKDLGTEVTAVLIGSDVMSLTKELAEYGADRIIVVDDPELKSTEPSLMHMHWLRLSRSTNPKSCWLAQQQSAVT